MGVAYRLSELAMKVVNKSLAGRGIVMRRRRVLSGDTSQNGEIAHIYPILADHPSKIVVDVGANHGELFSKSRPLIQHGWQAVLVEPNPVNAAACRKLYAQNERVTVVEKAVSARDGDALLYADAKGEAGNGLSYSLTTDVNQWTDSTINFEKSLQVATQRLDTLLSEQQVPLCFALLSIDTEGHDFAALSSIGDFRPTLILTERYVWNRDLALKKQALLTDLGYYYAARIGCNEVFVRMEDDYIAARIAQVNAL